MAQQNSWAPRWAPIDVSQLVGLRESQPSDGDGRGAPSFYVGCGEETALTSTPQASEFVYERDQFAICV